MAMTVSNRTPNSVTVNLNPTPLAAMPPYPGDWELPLGRIARPRVIRISTPLAPGLMFLELAPASSRSRSGTRVFPLTDGLHIFPGESETYEARVFYQNPGAVDATLTPCIRQLLAPITGGQMVLTWEDGEDITASSPREQGAIIPVFRTTSIGAGLTVVSLPIRVPVSGIAHFQAFYSDGMAGGWNLIRGPITESTAVAELGAWPSGVPLVAGELVTLSMRNTSGADKAVNLDMVIQR